MSECSMTLSGRHNLRWRKWGVFGHKELRCWCGKIPEDDEREEIEVQLKRTKQMLERQAAEEGGTAELYPVSGTQERLL